ncbi:hypothetical protein GCM10010206_20260 [Streptomyces cinerochromogenes]|nr:hypothetical protein GCM10010206_20260 [Streptomyces cinerochromogenes]
MLVLRLHTLSAALTQELLQYAWPHCGKIGRYVSHRARSLTGPTNVWFADGSGRNPGWMGGGQSRSGGDKGTNRSPATVVSAAGRVQVVVPSLWTVSPGAPRFDRMA